MSGKLEASSKLSRGGGGSEGEATFGFFGEGPRSRIARNEGESGSAKVARNIRQAQKPKPGEILNPRHANRMLGVGLGWVRLG